MTAPSSSSAIQRARTRAYRLLALLLISRPFGNLSLALGMKHFSRVFSANPVFYIRALLNPYVLLGVGLLVFGLLVRMAMMSVADLTFVLPLTALGSVIAAALGKFCLGEHVTSQRWLGILLIFAGTVLVSSTSADTSPHKSSRISS